MFTSQAAGARGADRQVPSPCELYTGVGKQLTSKSINKKISESKRKKKEKQVGIILVVQMVKSLPAMQETHVQSLCQQRSV